MHSLFRTVQISLNGTQVTQDDSNYHYKSYFEALLSYGNTAEQTVVKNQGFYMRIMAQWIQ